MRLIFTCLKATKTNNLDLHLATLQAMCQLYFAYDHPNYARYLSAYIITILNLPDTHPGARELLEQNGSSVSRSSVHGSRTAVDMTIEQTINKLAKSRSGIIGFSRNYAAYHRWCLTRHVRASYVESCFEMGNMNSAEITDHKDVKTSEMSRSEHDVCTVVTAFCNFNNPFSIENKAVIYCISSGIPASAEVESDLLRADKVGKELFDQFIQKRLVDKTELFHSPIKRQKLHTFAAMQVTKKVKSSQNKIVQIKAERNVFGQLVLRAQQHKFGENTGIPIGASPMEPCNTRWISSEV